jgi:REP element-mobilizing transposase RayT
VTEGEYHELFSQSVDAWLDAGSGECILKDPALSGIVADALRHFDGDRYQLESFVVMPNHIHVLFRLSPEHKLEDVIHSWKSFTAKEINKKLGRAGEVWQKDYWDRIVRDGNHRTNILQYIAKNPERARLREGSFAFHQKDVGGTPTLLEAIADPGIAINSGLLDGLATADAKAKMIEWLETNGKGTLLTTEAVLLNPNRHGGKPGNKAEVEKELKAMLGVKDIVWFKKGIEGDDTDGHIDDIVRFIREDAVICMVEPRDSDPNHKVLKEIRERLDDVKAPDGGKLEIIEIEMPQAIEMKDWRLSRLPASYANFLILNNAVLVPLFGNKKKDAAAED